MVPVIEPQILPPGHQKQHPILTTHPGKDFNHSSAKSIKPHDHFQGQLELEGNIQTQLLTGISVGLGEKEMRYERKIHPKI